MNRTLVATCGNPDAGDDAFGPRVAAQLRGRLRVGVELVELGMHPASLLDHLPGPDRLLIVDAIRLDETFEPWVEIDLRAQPVPVLVHDDPLSSHGLGLAFQLALAERLNVLPEEVLLVGAPVGSCELGSARTRIHEDTVSAVASRILALTRALRPQPSTRSSA